MKKYLNVDIVGGPWCPPFSCNCDLGKFWVYGRSYAQKLPKE